MLIVHVTSTDPAGAIFNHVRALNEHTEHTARLIATDYLPAFGFPIDIHGLYDEGQEIEDLFRNADVFHFHKVDENHEIVFRVRGKEKVIRPADYIEDKPVVYTIHGHELERGDPAAWAKLRYGDKPVDRPILCVTPDLEEIYQPLLGDRVEYFPNCVPVRDVRYMPRGTDAAFNTKVKGELRPQLKLVQTATNTILKNTHLIKKVVERLGLDLPVFFFQVGPNPIIPIFEALQHMRASHIVFDHMEGYYGLSSLQGLSMAKPTIAGLSEYTVNAICRFWGIESGDLPWVIARNEAQLATEITRLVRSEDARRYIGQRSRDFMLNVWSDRAVAGRLAELYESLERSGERPARAPARDPGEIHPLVAGIAIAAALITAVCLGVFQVFR